MCGEYGENEGSTELGRPHYHALIFNHDFSDKTFQSDRNGIPLYISKSLEKLWGKGYCTVGTVSLESAGYVARYTLKKITGLGANEVNPETGLKQYERLDAQGEVQTVLPEYTDMSRRPGIARSWFEQYKTDVFPDDNVVVNGKRMGTPRYYMDLLEKIDPKCYLEMKAQRIELSKRLKSENTPDRLADRETCLRARTINLKRNLK